MSFPDPFRLCAYVRSMKKSFKVMRCDIPAKGQWMRLSITKWNCGNVAEILEWIYGKLGVEHSRESVRVQTVEHT